MKMPNVCHLHAAGGYAKGGILNILQFLNVGVLAVRKPDGGSICEEGSDQGFEGDNEGLLLLAPVGASKSAKDIEASDRALDD